MNGYRALAMRENFIDAGFDETTAANLAFRVVQAAKERPGRGDPD
jgi:hypothetical protein